jgi:DNA-binding transcriptional LysR family regulator
MDRLGAMAVFVQTIDSGSLSAAARKLSMPLTSVSRKLAELESHLGAKLLMRSTRKLALTDAGRSYLAACRQMLDLVSEAESSVAQINQQPRGSVAVTAPLVFGRIVLLPMLADFLSDFPEIDLQLMLGDRNVDLLGEHIDLALRIGVLPAMSQRAIHVGSVREIVCASPSHLAHYGTPKKPDDLQNHPCVSFSTIGPAQHWKFSKGRKHHAISIHSRLTVNTAEAAIDAAIRGVGITRVLSYQVQDVIDQGRLVPVLREYESEDRPVNLLFRDTVMPLKLRAMIDYLIARLRARLALR